MSASSSSFSFPTLTDAEIVSFFHQIPVEDLSAPSSDFAYSIYKTIITEDLAQPKDVLDDENLDFNVFQITPNQSHINKDLTRKIKLYGIMRSFLHAINFEDFLFKDLLFPDPHRTRRILSATINFLLYKLEKMEVLRDSNTRLTNSQEEERQLKIKINELDQEALEYEAARKLELPVVEELQVEVNDLKQTVQRLNKEQMSLRTQAMTLKELVKTLKEKISQVDFELVKIDQENSKLKSRIVQSPDKLQSAIEEKKSVRAEEINAEKSSTLHVKERTARLEVLTKVCSKMSRQLEKLEALQEQVNSTKALEKEVKSLKARLSDGELSKRSLDAQIIELQGKVTEAEDLVKEMEKAKEAKVSQQTKKMESIKLEVERKMQNVKRRELEVEILVAKAEQNVGEIARVKEARSFQEQQILKKCEELANEYRRYAEQVNPILQGFVQEITCNLTELA